MYLATYLHRYVYEVPYTVHKFWHPEAGSDGVWQLDALHEMGWVSKENSLKQLPVGGIPTRLKNMKDSWDYYSQDSWKNIKSSKPPTRLSIFCGQSN